MNIIKRILNIKRMPRGGMGRSPRAGMSPRMGGRSPRGRSFSSPPQHMRGPGYGGRYYRPGYGYGAIPALGLLTTDALLLSLLLNPYV